VIEKAANAGIPVYTIGLAIPTANTELEERLIKIATDTKGIYKAAPQATDMEEIYESITTMIRSQYKLCYTTHNPTEDGTIRTVNVTVNGENGTDTYTAPSTISPANNPPNIVHTPVTSGIVRQAITISADVTDPDAGDSVKNVSLFYRVQNGEPDGAYVEIPMVQQAGSDTYQAEIPGAGIQAPV
ncbi:MAG: hypothetical protein GY771_05600, partial [bacterium]|nr:hypothetical protein [bacterium]